MKLVPVPLVPGLSQSWSKIFEFVETRLGKTIEVLAKLPLSHSVLPESRPFEVTRGGVRKREWEVCDRGGKMRESTCDPLRLRHWRKTYRRCLYLRPPYVPGSSLLQLYDQWTLDRTEGKRFFTSTHLLWSQAPRWGDLRLRRSQDWFSRQKIERFFWRDFSGEKLLPENRFLGQ